MLGTVRVQGGDKAGTNTSGGAWQQATQVAILPAFLTKLVVFVPTAIGANRVIWIFDTATGAAGSTDPVAVLVCPSGYTTTLDFGDYGKIFTSGLYLAVSTAEPASPASTVTAAANNDAKVSFDYRIK